MLYIIATPIGNLEDITLRALRVFKECDAVASEDTRVTKKLLAHYEIEKPLIRWDQHTATDKVINLLSEGKSVAYAVDSGTPGISDPGGKLVEAAYNNGFTVVPIPGASALTTVASVSGMPMDQFTFLGFPPQKNKRKKYFEKVAKSEYPVIFYESPHRIIKTLNELKDIFESEETDYKLVVARELTKQFESIYRGSVDEVLEQLQNDKVKGEFTVVINKINK